MIKNSHIHLFPSTIFADDSFQREVSQTTIAYNALGDRESVTDASGATTRYAYDAFGCNIAITNALGIATIYEYDARGNKTYEGGATYPVSYTYDDHNVMTNMTTYRAEGTQEGDTTSWNYDEATGLLLSKTYADGKGPTYTYTPNPRFVANTRQMPLCEGLPET